MVSLSSSISLRTRFTVSAPSHARSNKSRLLSSARTGEDPIHPCRSLMRNSHLNKCSKMIMKPRRTGRCFTRHRQIVLSINRLLESSQRGTPVVNASFPSFQESRTRRPFDMNVSAPLFGSWFSFLTVRSSHASHGPTLVMSSKHLEKEGRSSRFVTFHLPIRRSFVHICHRRMSHHRMTDERIRIQ